MANGYGAPVPFSGFGPGSYNPQGLNGWYNNLSPFGRSTYDTDPNAGYQNFLDQIGLGGAGRRAQFAQSQMQRYHNQFTAQLVNDPVGRAGRNDPGLNWAGYLSQGNVNPMQDFYNLSPQERGDQQSGQAPRLRWLMSVI